MATPTTSSPAGVGKAVSSSTTALPASGALLHPISPVIIFEERRWPYQCLMPLYVPLAMWIGLKKRLAQLFLGSPKLRHNSFLLEMLSPTFHDLRMTGGSSRACVLLYENLDKVRRGAGGWFDLFWTNLQNAQAIRNRLKLVKHELENAIRSFDKPEVRVLELASGSAIGLLEIVASMKREGITVRVLLLDIDDKALAHGMEHAERLGIASQVETIQQSAVVVKKVARDWKPDIIEMVGLLDYFDANRSLKLFRHIRESLPVGGKFITANVVPNVESFVVHAIFDWPAMIYRTPEVLEQLLVEAGFDDTRVEVEPLEIHALTVSSKNT